MPKQQSRDEAAGTSHVSSCAIHFRRGSTAMPGMPAAIISSSHVANRNNTATSQKADAEMPTSQLPRKRTNAPAQPTAISAPANRPAGAARTRRMRCGVAMRRTCWTKGCMGRIFVLEPLIRMG